MKELSVWQGHTRKALITRKNVRNVTLCKIKPLLSVWKTAILAMAGVCFPPKPPSSQQHWYEAWFTFHFADLGTYTVTVLTLTALTEDLNALSAPLGPCRAAGIWTLRKKGHSMPRNVCTTMFGVTGLCRDQRDWVQVWSLKDRGETISSMLGAEEHGWHSNDNELGQVLGRWWKGRNSPRVERKVASVMLLLSQFQSVPSPDLLAVSPCCGSL